MLWMPTPWDMQSRAASGSSTLQQQEQGLWKKVPTLSTYIRFRLPRLELVAAAHTWVGVRVGCSCMGKKYLELRFALVRFPPPAKRRDIA